MSGLRSCARLAALWFAVIALAPLARAQDSYGSIAFSPSTGAAGWTWAQTSKSRAESGALKECRKSAGDCRVGINFWNSCGAVALGDNGGWGSAWGETAELAQQIATDYCRQNTRNCRILRWQCSIP